MRPQTMLAPVVAMIALTFAAPADAATPKVCRGASSVCSTLAPAPGGVSVLTVYAPKNSTITAFDIWTGTKTSAVAPKAICTQAGQGDGSQYQLNDYFITRCRETIKPRHSQTYCFKGGGGTTFLAQPTQTDGISIDAGLAGQDTAHAVAAVSGCPSSVAKRKRK